MIIGTTIIHDGTGTTPYYSPAFPRGGDAALFSIDVTHEGGSPTMVVKVEHKNAVDAAFELAGTFSGITSTGVVSLDVTGLKELVRLSYEFSAGDAGDFFHVVVPAPAWRLYG